MVEKSQLFWKKSGDEAEIVQCPFNKFLLSAIKMVLNLRHFLTSEDFRFGSYVYILLEHLYTYTFHVVEATHSNHNVFDVYFLKQTSNGSQLAEIRKYIPYMSLT